ncbi:hypothetical protein AGMMS49992_23660 [Clostridia bacterium]|nr:hypothetical protein AGMMS49992_23660 [Clostridia bacterium]
MGIIGKVQQDIANAIPTSINSDVSLTGRAGFGASGGGTDGAGTVINQNISITTPKALSEKEISRELRTLSRTLALEY